MFVLLADLTELHAGFERVILVSSASLRKRVSHEAEALRVLYG